MTSACVAHTARPCPSGGALGRARGGSQNTASSLRSSIGSRRRLVLKSDPGDARSSGLCASRWSNVYRRRSAHLCLASADDDDAVSGVSYEVRWKNKFEELRAFKDEHGHIVIPRGDPTFKHLVGWVAHQRQKRRQGNMSAERQRALEEIGFVWEPSLDRKARAGEREEARSKRSNTAWENKFKELRAFKKKHGHVVVPRADPSFIPLCRWIVYQRRKRKEGTLSEERRGALEELGIQWERPAVSSSRSDDSEERANTKTQDERWKEKFDELRAFYDENGHTKVHSGDTKLHQWLVNQRRMAGNDSLVNERRVALESLGVDLNTSPRVSWSERLQELGSFRKVHGHCNVPATYRHNIGLGSWVAYQRKSRRAGTLSAKKIEALEKLGFEWVTKRGTKPKMMMHVRQKMSPWALVNGGANARERLSDLSSENSVGVTWLGGDEDDSAREPEKQRKGSRVLLKEKPKKSKEGPVVGGWGKKSAAYEEKQQFVFDRVHGWWKGEGKDGENWKDARARVRDMRYNYAVQAKDRRIKPDIVIEVVDEADDDVVTTWGLVIEVDEFAHRRGKHYSWSAEEERMEELQATLGVPLRFVRFNPDPTTANPEDLNARTDMLVEHVAESMLSSAPVRNLEVVYFLYD